MMETKYFSSVSDLKMISAKQNIDFKFQITASTPLVYAPDQFVIGQYSDDRNAKCRSYFHDGTFEN